jgi:MFS family permease
LFLFALDNTIVADVQPAVVEQFQAVDKVAWLATAFIIPGVGFMLSVGQLFQVFNAKWCYVIGVIIFEIGSMLCGGAPNIYVLISGRAFAGAGATIIYIGSLFLISVNTTEKER